ncbi:MAG: hypothetical protein HY646_05380, partial [Acidobacteria bacterium]|nr:hypothetical protein [Acidobacteriota bacterium]
ATVAFAQPGPFNPQGEEISTVQTEGRYGLRSSKWFSYDLPVDAAQPVVLFVTYSNDARQRCTFDILVDGRKVGEHTVERRSPEQDIEFQDVEYTIPADLLKGKRRITVRFQATGGNEIAPVFGIRTVRN